MSSIDELREIRLQKVELLRESGMDPYPARVLRDISLKDLRNDF